MGCCCYSTVKLSKYIPTTHQGRKHVNRNPPHERERYKVEFKL